MKSFGLIFFLLLASLFIVFAIQFNRGKWLRSLSGNAFTENRFSYDKTLIQEKKNSKILFLAAIIAILLTLYLFLVVAAVITILLALYLLFVVA